jgi:hypothetical protein
VRRSQAAFDRDRRRGSGMCNGLSQSCGRHIVEAQRRQYGLRKGGRTELRCLRLDRGDGLNRQVSHSHFQCIFVQPGIKGRQAQTERIAELGQNCRFYLRGLGGRESLLHLHRKGDNVSEKVHLRSVGPGQQAPVSVRSDRLARESRRRPGC